MNRAPNPQRRKFLGAATAAAGGAMVSCGAAKNPWRTLSAEEAATAAAAADRIIPPDAFPGAGAAGAADYIDRALSGHLKKLREAYRQGLTGIEQSARSRFGKPFTALAAGEQDQVLKAVEKNDQAFFSMLVAHVMQSYYGDPRHGGNRDGAGWRSIGYDATIVRGRS
jgi:gluconate 2-dehydrogenase gamma chain